MRSAYDILGVSTAATAGEIRRAYRALVRTEHPDVRGGTDRATIRFLEIRAAYEVLIDPSRRAAHDRDPASTMDAELQKRREAQRKRRRERLKKLY